MRTAVGDRDDAQTPDEKRLMKLVADLKWTVFGCGLDLSKADAPGRAILAHLPPAAPARRQAGEGRCPT